MKKVVLRKLFRRLLVEEKKINKEIKKKKPKDDILNIVKQFISYFEETDRSEKNDNSIKHS